MNKVQNISSGPNIIGNKPQLDKYKNPLTFVLSEKFITIFSIASIFTLAFIASLKSDIIDPLFHFIFPDEQFDYMDVVIRDGVRVPTPKPRLIELKFGNFFREFITYSVCIGVIFLLGKYTKFPDLNI